MKKFDVIALGELLIDFTENGSSEQGNTTFEANPGGAPCNVLAMLNRLGDSTAFIGKVGNDFFGKKLEDTINELGINTDGLVKDDNFCTTLAFVHNKEDGEREFSFFRNPGADMMLSVEDVNINLIKNSNIFHFGTLSMTSEVARNATILALETAKENNCIISFDPNIRENLWHNMNTAKEQVYTGLSYCNILKISDNEIQWLTDEADYSDGVMKIYNAHNIDLILVTMGKEGSRAYYKGDMIEADTFIHENTVETTGAGDTFLGCVLHFILQYGLVKLTETKLREMLIFANAAASIITLRKGALRVMPTVEEINKLISSKS